MTLFDGDVEGAVQPRAGAPAVGVAEVSHESIRGQLSDYLDNHLEPVDRARIEKHLQTCRSCRAYWRTLRATVRAVNELPRAAAPESARERLLRIPEA